MRRGRVDRKRLQHGEELQPRSTGASGNRQQRCGTATATSDAPGGDQPPRHPPGRHQQEHRGQPDRRRPAAAAPSASNHRRRSRPRPRAPTTSPARPGTATRSGTPPTVTPATIPNVCDGLSKLTGGDRFTLVSTNRYSCGAASASGREYAGPPGAAHRPRQRRAHQQRDHEPRQQPQPEQHDDRREPGDVHAPRPCRRSRTSGTPARSPATCGSCGGTDRGSARSPSTGGRAGPGSTPTPSRRHRVIRHHAERGRRRAARPTQTASPQVHATGSGSGSAIRQYCRSRGTSAKATSTSAGQTTSQRCQPSAVKIAQPSSCQARRRPSRGRGPRPSCRYCARPRGAGVCPGSATASAKYTAYLTIGPGPTSTDASPSGRHQERQQPREQPPHRAGGAGS